MPGRVWERMRRVVFWNYRRGSWQYDVIVVLILAFLFLVPPSVFNDRPSEAVVQEVEHSAEGMRVFWIDPGALDRANPAAAEASLDEILRRSEGDGLRIVRSEAARDAAGNVRAYVVYAEP